MHAKQALSRGLLAGLAMVLAACATTRMEVQWTNPEFKGTTLRDQPVLVACQARDFTAQAVCEDQFANQLAARGVRPIRFAVSNTGVSPTNEAIEAAAKRENARAVVRTTLSTSVPTVTPGPTIGIGIGGGGYSGGAAGGISMPIGGSTVSEAYAADTAIIDVASGKLMWTGRATSPTGGDVTSQLTSLTGVMFESLGASGLF